MGRNAAGESFLRGYLTHSTSDEFHALVLKAEHAQHFSETVKTMGRSEPVHCVDKTKLGELHKGGVLYYPGPGIGEQAFQRAAYGHRSWSLCGITHTTSSAGAMDAVVDLITSPVQPWDALICTSYSVKDNVTRVLQAQVDYLKDRLGVTKLVLPQMPVIPLGIHTVDFEFTVDQKEKSRISIGVGPDVLVVLFMGRLSFHAKAHPLAMYQALERASRQTGKEVLLIECGWHANDFSEQAFKEAAKLACPSLKVLTLDGRKQEERQTAWASADVFCSLSDNIQETFGITPIEAMAASIPVVVSDWDGYKDTVRDGIDGFRVPTLMPQEGLGGDLAYRHALGVDTYDLYCGYTSTLIAVDVEAATQAFKRLFESSELRQRMGAAGRERARAVFDWKTVIGQYEELWDVLKQIRLDNANSVNLLKHPWPARMDPFSAFASYPTQILTPDTILRLGNADVQPVLGSKLAYQKLAMVNFAEMLLPSEEELQSVLQKAADKPQGNKAVELIAEITEPRKPYVLRSLAWLVKLGILSVVKP
jgi:alpha-maltose-1-phosphate synthase